jgi:hypothetical protein
MPNKTVVEVAPGVYEERQCGPGIVQPCQDRRLDAVDSYYGLCADVNAYLAEHPYSGPTLCW